MLSFSATFVSVISICTCITTPTTANDYPWMVSLRITPPDFDPLVDWERGSPHGYYFYVPSFCSGVLIQTSPPVILTAASCFQDSRPLINENTETGGIDDEFRNSKPVYIACDINRTYPDSIVEDDIFETVYIKRYEDVHIHPKWHWRNSSYHVYDIALLIASDESVTFNDESLPLLPPQLDSNEACCEKEEEFQIIGYDNDSLESGRAWYYWIDPAVAVQNFFAELNLTALANATHIEWWENYFASQQDNHIKFMAYSNLTNLCFMDESAGNPMFRIVDDKVEIVGITAKEYRCVEGDRVAFTSVGHFSNWIWQTVDYAVDGLTWSPTADPTTAVPTTSPIPTTRPLITESPTMEVDIVEFITGSPTMEPTNNPINDDNSSSWTSIDMIGLIAFYIFMSLM